MMVNMTEFLRQAKEFIAKSNSQPLIDIFNKVVKQHYVPRKFLLNWSVDGSQQIGFRHKNASAKMVGVKDVAWREYNYAYPDLKPSDIRLLVQQVEHADDIDREFLGSHYYIAISLVTQLKLLRGQKDDDTLQIFKMMLEAKELEPQYKYMLCSAYLGLPDCDMTERLKLEVVVKNGFEGWMTIHENQVNPIIEGIVQKGDLSFWADSESACQFLHSLAIQLMRSPKYDTFIDNDVSEFGANHRDLMRFVRFASAYMLGKILVGVRSDYEASLIRNDSPLSFITGDQPLINLCGESKTFDFYYPLSPRVAVFYSKKGRLHDAYSWLETVGPREVDWLNKKLSNSCVSQLYADSKMTLELGGYKAGMIG